MLKDVTQKTCQSKLNWNIDSFLRNCTNDSRLLILFLQKYDVTFVCYRRICTRANGPIIYTGCPIKICLCMTLKLVEIMKCQKSVLICYKHNFKIMTKGVANNKLLYLIKFKQKNTSKSLNKCRLFLNQDFVNFNILVHPINSFFLILKHLIHSFT